MSKKNQGKKAAKANKGGAGEYFKGVKKEMGKVTWPTKEELGKYTLVVVLTCAVFALGFWLIDLGVIAGIGCLI